jgi:hypothetical protein
MKITVALVSGMSVDRESIRHPCGRTGLNAASRQSIFPPCWLDKGHVRVVVQLPDQFCSMEKLRKLARESDAAGG